MKFSVAVLLILCTLVLGAKTVQLPVELAGASSADERQIFVFGLPLPAGRVRELKNIQLSDADGREIPAQFKEISRWRDGSLRWVQVLGFVRLKAKQKCKIFVEYGERVLNSVHPGILSAESDQRTLIEAGAVSAEFLLKNFSLPQKISLSGNFCGAFEALPGVGEALPELSILEPGPLHMLVAMECKTAPRLGKMFIHFFYDCPFIIIQTDTGKGIGLDKVNFKGPKGFSCAEKRGKYISRLICRFDGTAARFSEPLTGVIPAWYYEMCGMLESPDPRTGEMEKFEKAAIALIDRKLKEASPEMLFEAFFRTGDRRYIAELRSRELSGVTGLEAMMLRAYGMELLPEQLAAAEKIVLPENGVVETRMLSRALDHMDITVPEERNRFCRGAAVLLRGFDPGSGGWFSKIDMRGAPAGECYADRQTNMICAKVMFKMEQLTSGMAFGEAALHAVRRMKIDGIAVEDSGDAEVFSVLDLCRRYLKRHPERAIPFGDGDFLLAHAPQNRAPLQMEVLPGMKIRLAPRAAERLVRLGCRGSEYGTLRVEDLQGRQLPQYLSGIDGRYRITLPETGAFLIYKGEKAAQWSVFNPEDHAVRLPLTEKMVRFFNLRASRFTFHSGEKTVRLLFRLRALNHGNSAILLLVSPGGKKFYLRDRNVDGSGIVCASELAVEVAESGVWQLFLHSSGGSVALGTGGDGIILEK